MDLRERQLVAAQRSDKSTAAVLGMSNRFTRSRLDLRERRLAATLQFLWRVYHDLSRRRLDLRQRELAAAVQQYASASGLELSDSVARSGMGSAYRSKMRASR